MTLPSPAAPLSPRSALLFLNSFRTALLLVLLLMSLVPAKDGGTLLLANPAFYLWSSSYAVLIALWFILRTGRLALTLQLTLAIAADIAMIVLLMGMNDGIRGGYGVLLLPYLAVAALLSSGRYALFYAAIATLALFGYVGIEYSLERGQASDLLSSAALAATGFITAIVTWRLGRIARDSEALAVHRGGEIANLNRLNELILQSQRDAVLVLNTSGLLQQFNQQAQHYFADIRRGQQIVELLPLVERWRQHGSLAAPLHIECQVGGQQLVGRMVPVQVDQVHGLVLFMRDQVDLAEEAKRIKLAALGRLTANIAHEIRNPLAAISHAAELLQEEERDPAKLRLNHIIQHHSQRINAIVAEVLLLNRRDRMQAETIFLPTFLHELLEHFGLAQAQAAAAIHCHCPPQISIRFDRGHLSQILTNLLNNAWRHASQQTGSVCIEVNADTQQTMLQVRDDGPGLSASAQVHLFEPFFTTEHSGTGLGLYIARELAEANDAQLDYCPPGGVFQLSCHKTYG
ncbi:ATP-binding protein [Neisseriaceae bacterium TC5R-5]|nr:ATP-binding protein [Neisseriaceae bacterium TC5R-5]